MNPDEVSWNLWVTAWGLVSRTRLSEVKDESLPIPAQYDLGLSSVSLSAVTSLLAHFSWLTSPAEGSGLPLLGIQAVRWQADLCTLLPPSVGSQAHFNLIVIHIKTLVFKDLTVTHPNSHLVPGMAKPELLRKSCHHKKMMGKAVLNVR